MEKSERNSGGDDTIARVPAFALCPPPRCRSGLEKPHGHACGQVASWMVVGTFWLDTVFYCNAHRPENAAPMAGDQVVRRIHVTCEVFLAGVDMREPMARAEAVGRLEAAITAAGGALDIRGVTSTVGRYPAASIAQGLPAASA